VNRKSLLDSRTVIFCKDGSYRWFSWNAVSKPEQGLFYAVVHDITDRKRAETAIRENEERYRKLFEMNPHPVWVYDRNTLRFLAVNNAAVQTYGYSRDEFLSMTILEIGSLSQFRWEPRYPPGFFPTMNWRLRGLRELKMAQHRSFWLSTTRFQLASF
jgi:PAS domain-containing protein